MTLDRFRQLAETWGGDIERWPFAEQKAARELSGNAEATRILAEQLQFDSLFASAPEVSEDRAGRAAYAVLQRVARDANRRPWYQRLLQPARLLPAATIACSALLGFWLAGSLPYQPPESALALVFDSAVPISMWVMQ